MAEHRPECPKTQAWDIGGVPCTCGYQERLEMTDVEWISNRLARLICRRCRLSFGHNGKEMATALRDFGLLNALDEEAFCQAAARAWCHPLNQSKVMDPDIAFAAAKEIREYVVSAPKGEKPT